MIDKKELIKILDLIERGITHIRESVDDMTENKLRGEIDMIANQIKFMLWDDKE